MKISGFTFIRNAIKYDFPSVEVIASALPLVDEFVVNVGKSQEIDFQPMVRSRYPLYDILKDYRHRHPQVMQTWISQSRRLRSRRNRWLNWRFYHEMFRHGFTG